MMTKRFFQCLLFSGLVMGKMWAVDMQAHMASDAAVAAYSTYQSRQAAYYTGNFSYTTLASQDGATLFGSLNALMGSTCRIASGGFSYNSLRSAYVGVDMDLNRSGYIIGYYNGQSINGTWDSGATWNREHTWPQSKGADKDIAMGHDMQSVRPASTSVNSERGNTPYGESGSYYDPNEVSINNSYYVASNNGSYRGDASRVIMYDYIVYGQNGSYKNSLYNGQAQLLSKLGTNGVFESVEIMLKWHMQDPPSLTEMVRNDGAQDYQGNRNPFIDYPELAIQMLRNEVTTYSVSNNANAILAPAYSLTTRHGFVAYLSNTDGTHPTQVNVIGAQYQYDVTTGRLTITGVTGAVSITGNGTSLETSRHETEIYVEGGVLHNPSGVECRVYDLQGSMLFSTTESFALQTLPQGIYLVRSPNQSLKVAR